MSQPRLIRRSLADFFRELVRGAMRVHEVESSEPAEHYLVTLLERFAKPPPGWDSRPLALDYLESAHTPRADRCAKLKHVGDTALFLSGVFMEHLERRAVSTTLLHVARPHRLPSAGGAWRRATVTSRADVFAEIAARFPDFVRVLSEISFAELFPNDGQTVRMYTRWLRTRGLQDAQWLLRRGIVPFDPGDQVAALTAAGGRRFAVARHGDREQRVARGLVDPFQLEGYAVEDLGALQRVPPQRRVIGSQPRSRAARSRFSLRKWLMTTTRPPGRQTRCTSRIIFVASGTTLTT